MFDFLSVCEAPATRSGLRCRSSRAQRGSALLFSLMALVVLMLGAVALVRSVSTGSLILGNLGFKQDATASAGQATRAAIQWLSVNSSSLSTDLETSGYYATNLDGLDVTGQQVSPSSSAYASRSLVNWDSDNCAYAKSGTYATCKGASPAVAVQDSTAKYVITRLCLTPGDPIAAGNTCPRPLNAAAANAVRHGNLTYADYLVINGKSSPYYRIVVRVVGARNTVSFTETIVHF